MQHSGHQPHSAASAAGAHHHSAIDIYKVLMRPLAEQGILARNRFATSLLGLATIILYVSYLLNVCLDVFILVLDLAVEGFFIFIFQGNSRCGSYLSWLRRLAWRMLFSRLLRGRKTLNYSRDRRIHTLLSPLISWYVTQSISKRSRLRSKD